MRKIKNKILLSFFFIALILTGIISFRTNSASAFTVPEDWAEENDDFLSASLITYGYYSNLCQGDDDWFNISIGVDEVIKVSLTFDGYQNNIELQLLDNSKMILDESYGWENEESVAWISDFPQYVYIKIFGDNNSEAYDMNVEIFPKGAYDDEYEDNEDFSQAQEHEIYPNFYHNLVNNDTDIYRIYFDNDFSIDIYNTSYLWASLYSDAENELTTFFVQDSHLVLNWAPTYHGYYYIFVTGPDLGDLYDMDIWITGIYDDDYEENDYLHEASPINFGSHGGMVQNDDDWYEVRLEPHEELNINLFYITTTTVMNLELYDENESPLAYGDWDGVHNSLWWTNGDYDKYVYIKITGDNIGDLYDIDLILNGQTGDDDDYEENDYFYESREIQYGIHNNLVQKDDDWYQVWLDSNEYLEVYLFYDLEKTWMNLELYDENENPLLSGYYMNGDDLKLNWTNPDDLNLDFDYLYLNWTNDDFGRYFYFKVTGDNSGDSLYYLGINIIDEDDYKNNSDDPFANFDLSSLPGFPIEIVGFSVILSSLALIFLVKKKKH